MAELDHEAIIRTWAARRRVLDRFQYVGIVIFLVVVFGTDFLLPRSLADHGVAVRIVLLLALVALYIAVLAMAAADSSYWAFHEN